MKQFLTNRATLRDLFAAGTSSEKPIVFEEVLPVSLFKASPDCKSNVNIHVEFSIVNNPDSSFDLHINDKYMEEYPDFDSTLDLVSKATSALEDVASADRSNKVKTKVFLEAVLISKI